MQRIRAGALRSPGYLGRPTITRDAAGGESIGWDELKTFAAIEAFTGREFATGLVKDSVDARISLRLSDGWQPSARWRWRDSGTGEIYSFVAVMVSAKNHSAECLAKLIAGGSDGR